MRLRNSVIGAVLMASVVGLMAAYLQFLRHGELADKPGWAVLQNMHDPDASIVAPTMLVRRDGFAALGFLGVGEPKDFGAGPNPRWSWVLLNEHDVDGQIKQMPRFASYKLPCAALASIEQSVPDADASVSKYLKTICTGG